MRGVTRTSTQQTTQTEISTHTPHARRDYHSTPIGKPIDCISTHTPHARRDVLNVCYILIIPLFQLTRLMRGVTIQGYHYYTLLRFQLTRLMRGVTTEHRVTPLNTKSFQLTRLMRGVTTIKYSFTLVGIFQLTRLMRGVTSFVSLLVFFPFYFNSHASCEA